MNTVFRSRGLCAAALAVAGLGFGPGLHAAPDAVPAGYTLVWADEFDADGLPDPKKWVNDTGMNKTGWHNRELQYYAGPREANAVARGGRLHITARLESLSQAPDWGGQRYTSARLRTFGLADWTYGFFDVRAKLPCGRGTWSAIWTLGSGGAWPDDGELDILEHVGQRPQQVSSAVHTRSAHAARPVWAVAPLASACTQFHDYQMLWTADGVMFGVDGRWHVHYPNPGLGRAAWPFDRPQYLLLNLAIGGDLGGPVDDSAFPATMEVEYVRVYQPAPPAVSRP